MRIPVTLGDMLSDLHEELLATTLRVCRKSLERHAGEDYYFVGLYTSGDCAYVADSFATFQGLNASARQYLRDPSFERRWGTLETAAHELKWSPCDSPYHCEFQNENEFEAAQRILEHIWEGVDEVSEREYFDTCESIRGTMIAVLGSVRDSGLFDKRAVLFNVVMGDEDDESRVLTAELLNCGSVLARYRRELAVDEAKLAALRKS